MVREVRAASRECPAGATRRGPATASVWLETCVRGKHGGGPIRTIRSLVCLHDVGTHLLMQGLENTPLGTSITDSQRTLE